MKTLRLYGAGLLVALLLTLTACVPSTSGVFYPNFTLTLSLNPDSLTVQQGSSGTTRVTIIVHNYNRFTGMLSLYLSAPSGVSGSVTPVIRPSEVIRPKDAPLLWIWKLTIGVDSSVAPGTYDLQVKATFSGVTKTATLSLTVIAPGAGTTLTLRTSGANDLNSVAHGSGLFVAVGERGTILTSPDGVSWTARASGTDEWLWGVAYGNGRFVAVGGGGAILTSPDGVTWTQRTSLEKSDLLSVAYGNGLFVVVGSVGTILTSP